MGLDCYASIYQKRIFMTDEIEKKFVDAKISLSECNGSSFRGKSYDTIIGAIADDSLYFVGSEKLIYERLCNFLEQNKDKLKKDDETYFEIDIRNYIQDYPECRRGNYTCGLYELYGLQKFFKICVENNLTIHSSF